MADQPPAPDRPPAAPGQDVPGPAAPVQPAPGPVANAPASPQADAAPPRARQRRWPHAVSLLFFLMLLALPVGLGWLALHDARTLPALLKLAPGVVAEGVEGTLAGGRWRIRRLDWTLPSQVGRLQLDGVTIEGLSLSRAPHAGVWLAVHWQSFDVASATWTTGPPPAERRPPATLRMPVALDHLPLRIAQLQADDLPPATGVQATVTVGANAGAQHRLDGLRLTIPQATVTGQLAIGTDAPLPVQAALTAQATGAAAATRLGAWQLSAQASGPLDRLTLKADLRGGDVAGAHVRTGVAPRAPAGAAAAPHGATAPAAALQAQATVALWAGWPLQALALSTQALDLSALSPAWPRTALDGRANIASQGLKAPVDVTATFDNRLPGTLDSGRLPLRQLRLVLRGDPRQTDRLSLESFELQLADANAAAGQAKGSGRWQGDTLVLDLALADLQPARLHSGAAALSVAGPVNLTLSGLPLRAGSNGQPAATSKATRSGPHLVLKADLAGRALDGSGLPVKIRLEGEADAHHVLVRQAEATAGDARASFTLDAQLQTNAPTTTSTAPLASARSTDKAPIAPPASPWRLRAQAKLSRFDPVPWWRGGEGSVWRRGPHRMDADASADLLWQAGREAPASLDGWRQAVRGEASLKLADSVLAGVPVAGQWRLQSDSSSTTLKGEAVLAGNRLQFDGQAGRSEADDRGLLEVQATALPALAPLRALVAELSPSAVNWWPTAGELQGRLQWQGRWPAVRSEGQFNARAWTSPALALQQASLGWRHGDAADAPLMAKLDAQGLRLGGAPGSQGLDRLQAQASGNLRQHSLQFLLDSAAKPPAWTETLLGPAGTGTRLEGHASGTWAAAADGSSTWRVQDIRINGGARDAQGGARPWLAAAGLAAELRLDRRGQPLQASVAPGRVQLLTTALNWREASWQAAAPGSPTAGPAAAARLTVMGELETIDVARLLARVQPNFGWGGDLTVGGRIEIRSAKNFDADVVLERGGGDLTLTDELGVTQSLGVTDLRLSLSAHDGLWQFAQGLAGRSIGEMAGAQVLRTTPEQRWPAADAPLQGVLEARVANMGIWGAWVPPGWRLGGALRTTATFGGTLGAPELRGEMRGSQLAVRNVLQGVNVSDGELAITLSGERAEVERLVFKGGEGQLTLTGDATLGAKPSVRLQLAAERFRLLGRIDRRIVITGKAGLQVDPSRLLLDGQVTVDEGLIDISRGDAPSLDDDVQVHRGNGSGTAERAGPVATPLPAPLRNAQINLAVNLGDKLRLRGRGVDTGLRGALQVSSPGGRLSLTGTVRSEGGTFAAYGQNLEIARGEVVFSGAIDNPRLDVRAVRPNLDVVVGVALSGSALNPRVRLFSEPELAEYDKLSWLVLGRGPEGLGRSDTALLQRAASALLSGDGKAPTDELLGALGITDFSLRQTEGTVRETVVSLGRQLSRRWYLGYERSVNATTGTWQLVYRAAQRFTLRAQSGADNAIDAIWSWRW